MHRIGGRRCPSRGVGSRKARSELRPSGAQPTGLNATFATVSPSTAFSTEMAGVITPSPKEALRRLLQGGRFPLRVHDEPIRAKAIRYQRQQGEIPALAVMVGTQNEVQILNRDHQDERLDHQRGNSEHVLSTHLLASSGEQAFMKACTKGWCQCRQTPPPVPRADSKEGRHSGLAGRSEKRSQLLEVRVLWS